MAPALSRPDNSACRLLALPAELRNSIYSLALGQTVDLTWDTKHWNEHYRRTIHPLIVSCRKLYLEALPFACHTLRLVYPVEKPMRVWTALQHRTAPAGLVVDSMRELHIFFQESRFLYFGKFAAQVDALQSFIDAAPRLEAGSRNALADQ